MVLSEAPALPSAPSRSPAPLSRGRPWSAWTTPHGDLSFL